MMMTREQMERKAARCRDLAAIETDPNKAADLTAEADALQDMVDAENYDDYEDQEDEDQEDEQKDEIEFYPDEDFFGFGDED